MQSAIGDEKKGLNVPSNLSEAAIETATAPPARRARGRAFDDPAREAVVI